MNFEIQERCDERPLSTDGMLSMCQSESNQEKRNRNNYFNKDSLMWGIGQMGFGRNTDKTKIISSGSSFIFSTKRKRKDWGSQKT